MSREIWERASTEGMALTLAYAERISPPILLSARPGCDRRSAELYSAVSRNCIPQVVPQASREHSEAQPTTSRRYGGLKICAPHPWSKLFPLSVKDSAAAAFMGVDYSKMKMTRTILSRAMRRWVVLAESVWRQATPCPAAEVTTAFQQL